MGPEELEKGGAETAKEAGKRIENGGRVGQAATAGTGVNPTFKSRRSKPSSDRKLAYARLQGTGRGALDHRVRTKTLTIGRKGGGADCELKGDAKTVSRLHAKLEWSSEERCWVISCLSKKNPLVVDGVPVLFGTPPLALRSSQLIELGDTGIYFLGPRKSAALVYTNDIEETEAEAIRKRKAKTELAQRASKQAKKKEERKPGPQKKKTQSTASKARVVPKDFWTKKEKSDFLRGLFATGTTQDANGNFDWTGFRAHSGGLTNKDDAALKEYYDRLMKDVEMLMTIAKESKADAGKNRRTQHKDSCECVICEHSRRKAARIAAGKPRAEDLAPPPKADRDEEDDEERQRINAAAKEKMDNALVSLVTAQKLRVRLGLIEASHDADTPHGKSALEKLSLQAPKPAPSGETLPDWWVSGKHDRELMIGVSRHGVGKWEAVWKDPSLEAFAEAQKEKLEEPHARAAMRRLRDVSSAILAEKRRQAKRVNAPRSTKPAPKKPAPRKATGTRSSARRSREILQSSEDEDASDYEDKADDDTEEASEEGEDSEEEEAEEDDEKTEDDNDEDAEDDRRKTTTRSSTKSSEKSRTGDTTSSGEDEDEDDDADEEVEEIVEEIEEDDEDEEDDDNDEDGDS
uniref:FHA domain-containing protein n=2 Tax=Rhodosorus marinus TaxID=101924 RepID=A0A7S2ZN98_9RHOD|mmetsp:Transcript_25838/g.101947  ORF Transcript_25838/g.101947 Transcript_25838/m.101947 type:complete len:633 (+) Transcript_25838:2916-4814(+)